MKNKTQTYRSALWLLALVTALPLLYSCASIGNPSGGPVDEDPPRVVRTVPADGATDFRGNRIEIDFNELVNVKDAFTNVVVSPPTATTPKVSASGRKVFVEWGDTMLPNTTYTIDFGTAIEDLNESNPLGNYSFTFSTGPDLDSLRLSGIVLDAATLEPQQGFLVGAHLASAPDTALRTLRFARATKTDELGRFTLRGLKAEPYRLFALGDLNNDYRWDNPAELIAFYPTPVTPYAEADVTTDTIYNLHTGAVDTVVSRERTLFKPNNLLLSVFDIGYKPQYLVKYERPDSARLQFILNTKAPSLPGISFPDLIPQDEWAVTEHTVGRDTITYWLSDRRLIQNDTLRVALTYPRTNQQQILETATDTLTLIPPRIRAPKETKKKTAKQLAEDSIAAEKAKWFTLNVRPGGTMDIYGHLTIEATEPVLNIDTTLMRLEQKVDTLWKPLHLPPLEDDTLGNVRTYTMRYPWEFDTSYRLTIDSTAMLGITGRPSATVTNEFRTRKTSDYASLTLRLQPDTLHGFVEVLNSSDNPVARTWVEHGVATFPYLSPADYYARFIETADSVMIFHPGDVDSLRQPDNVYYYPKLLSLKRYDRNEVWNLNATAVDQQKPNAIKKNKPKRKKGENKDLLEENTEEDDYFDVNANPFDPKSSSRNRSGRSGSNRSGSGSSRRR